MMSDDFMDFSQDKQFQDEALDNNNFFANSEEKKNLIQQIV